MKVTVILNPYANRWGAQAKMPAVRAALARAGLTYDLVLTTAPGEATQRALQAAQEGVDAVVAAGGDGTVSEVVNGLIRAADGDVTRPLGILPIGTGNDFGDMMGIPRALDEAAAVIAAGESRQVDAGRVNDHFFDNNCALAMEPMVTIENVRMQRLSGNLRYVAALVKGLLKLRAWHMRIRWDDGEHEGPMYLLSVCNSPRTGGVFYMAPGASMDDGLFDFVFAPEMPKWRVLTIVPRLFKGSHLNHPLVTHGRTRRLTVESDPGTPIHADGEIVSESERRIAYRVLPRRLRVLVP
ncbi:MAG: diacylglycerol kinase family lipid kinase [Candidatus Promineifilaceae bacterium]|nr:diacylglycerol kinase family lipid kinase [Candidatus Promineifilaceae bacterium]